MHFVSDFRLIVNRKEDYQYEKKQKDPESPCMLYRVFLGFIMNHLSAKLDQKIGFQKEAENPVQDIITNHLPADIKWFCLYKSMLVASVCMVPNIDKL